MDCKFTLQNDEHNEVVVRTAKDDEYMLTIQVGVCCINLDVDQVESILRAIKIVKEEYDS